MSDQTDEGAPEDWLAFKGEINARRKQAWEVTLTHFSGDGKRASGSFGKWRDDLLEMIHKDMGRDNPRAYAGYHSVIGSSPFYSICPKQDLPDPYSIKEFYNRIINGEMDWSATNVPARKPDAPSL